MKDLFAPKRHYDQEEPAEAIIAIEYHQHGKKWLPHSVETEGRIYDFVPCVDGQIVYHCSGSGGGDTYELSSYCGAPAVVCKLWYDHTKVKLIKNKQPVADDAVGQFGYQIVSAPIGGNPFELPDAQEDDGGTEYCVQCHGDHPEQSLCRHIKYEEGVGHTLGCGASEVDFGETQASLYRLLRMLSPKAVDLILKNLQSGKWHSMFSDSMLGGNCSLELKPHWLDIYCEPLGNELRYEERYYPGIAWLHSLDSSCKEAIALTIGWLWMYQRAAWRGCCVVPEHTFIRRLPEKEFQKWLALDPLEPELLHTTPLRVNLNFKGRCANDFLFQANPKKCHEVILWPNGTLNGRGLTLSVADVKYVRRKAVDIYFGAVIERNGKHISELEDYNLTKRL